MAKAPGQDRAESKGGFTRFRDILVAEGKLPALSVPRRGRGPAGPPDRPSQQKTNVLWLMADQLRGNVLGCMGHPVCRTPNMDRLAASGALFTRSYCTEPVCVPSRAAMLTGHYPFTNGAIGNGFPMHADHVAFPTRLADAGFRTANIGKHHTGRGVKTVWEEQHTVEDAFGATKPSKVPFDPENFPGLVYVGGKPVDNSDEVLHGRYPAPAKVTKSYLLATEARKWLYYNDDPRPFLLRVSFDDPHPPVIPPEPYYSMYGPDDVPDDLIEGRAESLASKSRMVHRCFERRGAGISELDHRKHAAAYFGLVSHLDAQVGRVLDALDEYGYTENTIVILNSDHGHMIGEHGLVHKGPFCYEGTLRIPTIIRWPGRVSPGQRIDALVEGVDLAPTVLDMLKRPVPDDLHGQSWRGLLEGKAERVRDFAFAQWEDYVFCIVGERWKLTWYPADEEGELYDLRNDPRERVNLYDDAGAREVRDDLLARLDAWRDTHARPEALTW